MKTRQLLCMFLLCLSPIVASAQTEFTADGFTYQVLEGNTVALTQSPSDINGEVIIPSTVSNEDQSYDVTTIGASAFYNRKNITSMTLPNTVISIGERAFEGCKNLASFEMSDRLETLGKGAFTKSGITSITLPGTLKVIPGPLKLGTGNWGVFERCFSLTSVTLNEGIEEIGTYAFFNCTALPEITIPASVKKIGRAPFAYNNNSPNPCSMKRIIVADSDEPLELANGTSEVSNGNGNLTPLCHIDYFYLGRDVNRENSTITLVYDCDTLEVGPKVTSIGDNEYKDCSGLLTVLGMENVQSIGTKAFNNCRKLTSVPIGNKLATMGDFAFQDCQLLESISLPGTLKIVPYEAFENCFALASVTLGEGIEEIGNGAFYDTDALTEITIPASVKKIGRAPFYCNSTQAMKRMIIADSDTPLEFANGTNEYNWGRGNLTDDITLDYFYLGRDVNRVYFEHSLAYGAKEIEIGPKVTTISGTNGLFYATSDVENVKVHHVTPIAITDADFYKSDGVYEKATLWVPGGTVADYQAAEGWKNFSNMQTWSYVVNFSATGHGSIAIDDEVAKGGEAKLTRKPNGDELNNSRFTVTLTPETGYELTSLTQEDLTEATQAEEIFKDNESFTNPFTVETAINHDLSYVATFAPITYTIAYDLAGGQLPEGKENPKEYTIESEAITLTNPTRTGYDFLGWTGTGLTEPTVTVTIAKGSIDNRTYTATWKANSYKVHFDANNGEGEMADQTFTYDEAAKALTANAFTRLGYTFTGWNSQADGSGTAYTDEQEVKNLTATDGATITLYAQWQIVTYAITYNLDGGTVEGNPTEYTVETETFTLENPAREGYTFTGWTGTGLTEPTMTVTIVKGSTGEREYSATYEEIPVIIPADVNGDGAVDVADIATVISVMAGSAAAFESAADVNGDGAVDVADIASIISIMAANARESKIED